MKRIVSLLPAATEIAGALGLIEQVVGVSHECDFPSEANHRPRVTHCPVHNAGLSSKTVDEWVRQALRERGTIYQIDESLLRELRPDLILTQKLCDVCAVNYGTVARLASTLPGPPEVINLEPSSVADVLEDIRRVARACDVMERGEELVASLKARIDFVRTRAAEVTDRPRCFLLEWVEPLFCSGHWGPELVEMAGGIDSLGRKHEPSTRIEWREVLEAAPEIIVLALCGYPVARAAEDLEILRSYSGFETLPAAQTGRIYLTDASSYFARPGPRIVESLELLAGVLHPELFPQFAVSDERIQRWNPALFCPLCGRPNECALARKSAADNCWCREVSFPRELFDQLAEADLRKRCICRQCAKELPCPKPEPLVRPTQFLEK